MFDKLSISELHIFKFYFEIRPHSISQPSLKLSILLSHLPKQMGVQLCAILLAFLPPLRDSCSTKAVWILECKWS